MSTEIRQLTDLTALDKNGSVQCNPFSIFTDFNRLMLVHHGASSPELIVNQCSEAVWGPLSSR